jgi:outer membrane protein assembly factor BamA
MNRLGFLIFIVCWTGSALPEDRVAIYGLDRIRPELIRDELHLNSGVMTDSLLMCEQAWLWRLGIFRRVELLRPEQDPSSLLVIVKENDPLCLIPLLNYDRLFGWYGGAEATYSGLGGGCESVTASAELGGLERFILAFDKPPLGSSRFYTRVELSQIRFDYRYPDHPAFRERDRTLSAALGREFGRTFRLALLGLWERVRTDAPSVMLSKGDDGISGFGFDAAWDTRDWPDYPMSGALIDCRWVHRLLPKGWMNRAELAGGWSIPLGSNVLALGTNLQLSSGTVPVYKRIHLGGHDRLRGFQNGSIPGESGFWLTTEYRIPWMYIRDPAAGIHAGYAFTVFMDAGQAWYGSSRPAWGEFRGAVGIGGQAIWDRSVLRMEIGVSGDGLFITTGTSLKF